MNVNMGRGAVHELLRRSSLGWSRLAWRRTAAWAVTRVAVLARVAVHRVYPIRGDSLQLKLNLRLFYLRAATY